MMKKSEILLKPEGLWILLQTLISIALIFSLTHCKKKTSHSPSNSAFTFNLPREIKNLDPLMVRGINQRYLLFNIHRGLYYYNKDNKLTAHGAKECTRDKDGFKWTCELQKLNYANKKKITAKDYINTFDLIKKLNEESLESIQNIEEVTLVSKYTIQFQLKKGNLNFKHQLTDINLTPRENEKVYEVNDKSFSFSGPYYVASLSESEVLLKPNIEYQKFNGAPDVLGVFVDDAAAALNLFESGHLDFLRYLETSYFPKYKDEAFLSPHIKLDGIFLSPGIPFEIRKKLVHSLEFKKLKKIFSSKGTPGCLQISQMYFGKLSLDCFEFQKDLEKIDTETLKISVPAISQKDHVRLAEWLKSEWYDHLNLKTEIEQLETKIFYQQANEGKLQIYRRSVPLKELQCDHAKTQLLKLPEFKLSGLDLKLECSTFFKKALQAYLWIPLGLVHLSHLQNNEYTGYYINILDQFGLEDLKRVKKDKDNE